MYFPSGYVLTADCLKRQPSPSSQTKFPPANNQPGSSDNNKVFTMATVQQARAPEKKKERPSALRSIIAGSTAGAVEIGELSNHR
jgi:hypothetical protein